MTSSYSEGAYGSPDDGSPKYSHGLPFNLEDSVAEPLPPTGALRFDYVSTDTAHRQCLCEPVSEAIFAQLERDVLAVWGVISTEHQCRQKSAARAESQTQHAELMLRHRKKNRTGIRSGRPSSREGRRRAAKSHRGMTKQEHLSLLSSIDIQSAVTIQAAWRGLSARIRARIKRAALAGVLSARVRTARATRLQVRAL